MSESSTGLGQAVTPETGRPLERIDQKLVYLNESLSGLEARMDGTVCRLIGVNDSPPSTPPDNIKPVRENVGEVGELEEKIKETQRLVGRLFDIVARLEGL